MDSGDAIQFIVLIILLFLSGFFSSAETALTTVSKITMRSMADDGDKRAALVLNVIENQKTKMLSAILIGNNIVNISDSSLATTLAYSFGGYMVSIVTAVLTVLILVFGEITPKSMATLRAVKFSLSYIRVIHFLMTILTPFIFIVNLFSRGILVLLRINPDEANQAMTEDELRTIVDVSHEDGVIDIYKEDKFTRLPVYEDTTDNVIGTINMKDLLLFDDREHFKVRDILREAYFTYEYKNISELLVEMRDASINIAIVLDEYGETAGIITLEDILEEIVGEIHDEYDENEEDFIRKINDLEYIIEGSVSLVDLNDRLKLDVRHQELESEDFDSLGGFMIEHLDRLPEVGDEFTTEE